MVLIASLVANVALLVSVFWLVYRTKKPGTAQKTDSQLLAELLSGGAVVVVKTLDPQSIFYWSPRDRQ